MGYTKKGPYDTLSTRAYAWCVEILARHTSILYIFCWLSWEVSGFLSFMDCWANSFDRALLATIRDKGICPCPWCLVPKSQLDQTGTKCDSRFRIRNNHTYLFDRVLIAWNAIYKSAAAITSAAVNHLLKVTSSIPTLVCQVPWYIYLSFMFHS